MTIEMDSLKQTVCDLRTIDDGVEALLDEIAKQLNRVAGDEKAVRAIAHQIGAERSNLANAIAANTPRDIDHQFAEKAEAKSPGKGPKKSGDLDVGDDFTEKIEGETYAEHVARAEAAGLKPKGEAAWDVLTVDSTASKAESKSRH